MKTINKIPQFLLLLIVAVILTNLSLKAQTKPWLFTYIADWNYGNPMTYGQVDWAHYDVIIDFGVAPGHTGDANFPAGTVDTSGGLTLLQRDSVVARAHSQGKKILLSITEYPCTYWDQCTTPALISGYCQSISRYVKEANAPYDGIDVDWEFPSNSDSTQFKNFLDSIRVYLPSPTYLVTLTSGQWAPFGLYAEKQSDIDMVNLMIYDGDGVSSGWPSWFMGPVYGANMVGKPELSCDAVVDSFARYGVPLSKIAISTEFGGDLIKGGTTTDSMGITINSNGITAPGEMWTAQPSGQYDIAYYNNSNTGIFQKYYNSTNYPGVAYHWNSTYQGSFLSYDAAGTANDWELSFDDTNDITAKFNYVASKGIGGYFFYELGMSYNHTTGTFPFQSLIDADEFSIFGHGSNPPPPVKDTIPPTVAITSPTNGSTVSGTITLSATASDNVGVTSVVFKVDTTKLASLTSSPYTASWNTATYANGSHTVSATASDAAGNLKTATITVTVSNVSVKSPTATTSAASSITTTSATLNGTVNPNGSSTTNYFQYGNSTNYGSTTQSTNAGAGSSSVTVSASLNSLISGTTYHYRLVATNAGGTTNGNDVTFITLAPPAPPSLTSPANGSTNLPLSDTLSWSASQNATRYQVEVSTSTSFSSMIINDSTVTSTSRITGALSGNTTYYWRVQASNTAGASGWSSAWSFTTLTPHTAPSVPSLTSPANGSTNLPLSDTLSWSASQNATRYQVEVSTSASFSSTIINDSTITSTSRITGALSGNTTYYWRVQASNTAGASGWSSAWSFTTLTPLTAPSVPSLTSPANGSTNLPLSDTLSWSASQNATRYQVEVSTSASFSSTIINDSTVTSTSRITGALSGSTTYYWRVQASNTAGASGWSSAWSFTTLTPLTAPSVPSLTSPANGSTNLPLSDTLSWSASQNATRYQVEVSTSASFSSTIINDSTVTSTSRITGALSGSTTYYWRVQASNTAGASGWSSAWSFTTLTPLTAPSVPSLTSPANGSTNLPLSDTLSWSASQNATRYQVEVSTSASFSSTIINDSTVTSTSRITGALSGNTTYYWRVQASNTAGASGWSSAWSFTTSSAASSILIVYDDSLHSPWINATWSATVNLSDTSHVYPGNNRSIGVVQKAGGALSLHYNTGNSESAMAVVASSCNDVQFAVYSDSSASFSLLLENDQGNSFPEVTYGSILPKQWNVITIPMSELDPSNQNFTWIDILETSRLQKTYYVDNLELIENVLTGVKSNTSRTPANLTLEQNYPNPFNPSTAIVFSTPSSGHVTLKVYNILGQEVADLSDGNLSSGSHTIVWNAQNMASGIYIYRLQSNSAQVSKKMILMK